MGFQRHVNRDIPLPCKKNADKENVAVFDANAEQDIRESLLATNILINDLSRALDLNPEYISHVLSNFKSEKSEMSVKDLALLNEMLIGACLKQLA